MERSSLQKIQKTPARVSHPQAQSAGLSSAAHPLSELQRSIGNHAVQRLIQSPYIQTKLQISTPGDTHEQEADRVADTVMRMPDSEVSVGEEEEEQVQRKEAQTSAPKVMTSVPANIHAMSGGGSPLPPTTRAFFEPRFGTDFSQVRVHTDGRAEESARSINARAFTLGRDIAFGAGQYAPESNEGKRLLAHELAHTIQQGTGGASTIQCKEKSGENNWTTIVQITVEARATGEGRGKALTSGGQTLPLSVEANRLSIGTHEMGGLLTDPEPGEWHRIHVSSKSAGLFVYMLPPDVTVARDMTVIVKQNRRNLIKEIQGLRKGTRDYLMQGSGPPPSDEALQNVLSVGRALEAAGLTDDELLLLQYAETGRKPLTGENLETYLEQREFEISEVFDTRAELIKYGNLLASLSDFPYPLPPLASLQNLLPAPLAVLDRQLDEDSSFRSVTHLRDTLNLFKYAFDKELFGLAMSVLNGVEVGLIKMEARFVGHLPERRGSPSNLVAELNKIKANPKVIKALEALRKAKGDEPTVLQQAAEIAKTGAAPRQESIEKLESKVDEAVAENSLLKLFSGTSVELLEAKTGEEAQNKLIDFILDGRATVRRARAALDLDNPGTLYWDKIVAAQKARMGVEPGSMMDDIINQIVKAGLSASSFWDKVWSVLQVIIMFLPGPLGFALRTITAVIDTDKAISEHRRKMDAFETGMSSKKPDVSDLYTQIAFTAAGVAVDASLTRFIPKTTGRGAKITAQEAVGTGEAAVGKQAGKVVGEGEKRVVAGGEKLAKEVAQKEIKNIGTATGGALKPDTVALLNQRPLLRSALAENSLAARALKKCKSPCYPPSATPDQVRALEQHLERVKATGKYNEDMLREYLHANLNDLDKAIAELSKHKTSRHLNSFLGNETRMPIGPVKRVKPREDPRIVGELTERSHDLGVKYGEKYAVEQLKLSKVGFSNPFQTVGKYGQGFDDIMVLGADLDNGLIYILEYKGGTAALSAGQMELQWVVGNIRRLFYEGGPKGQDMARKLSKALRDGRMRGVALSSPTIGETKQIASWVYDSKGAGALNF